MLDREGESSGQPHHEPPPPAWDEGDIARDDFQRDFERVGREGDPDGNDCFAPPKEPCECYCLHCQRTFMSDGIWFQKIVGRKGREFDGFWMCPTPNCDGKGFTFDIFPTDPDHPANDGWTYDDGDEYEDDEDPEFAELDDEVSADADAGAWDPTEAKYAALDEEFGDADDDIIEGDEWKLGPNDDTGRPRAPLGWSADARREWEEEQARYDAPDERPREIDWSDRPEYESFNDDDIPF